MLLLRCRPLCGHVLASRATSSFIQPEEFESRRATLYAAMDAASPNTSQDLTAFQVAIFPGNKLLHTARHIPVRFRQESNLRYLCGNVAQPDSVLVLHRPSADNPAWRSCLFVPTQTAQEDLWVGPAAELPDSNVDDVADLQELRSFIHDINQLSHQQAPHVWFEQPHSEYGADVSDDILQCLQPLLACPTKLPCSKLLHDQRWLKTDAEVSAMRSNCEATGLALARTMCDATTSATTEAVFAARLAYEAACAGLTAPAYPPVVAGGDRANTIHYLHGERAVGANELLLVDVGFESNPDGYCSDLSRTFAPSGAFTRPQAELYDRLCDIQEKLLDICRYQHPLSLDDLHHCMLVLLGEALQELGVVDRGLDKKHAAIASSKFCPHHVGHYLGLDVHDAGHISRCRELRPGAVITVEPGIYIRASEPDVPAAYRGIGMRVEDDVVIHEHEIEVLTAACPRTRSELERMTGRIAEVEGGADVMT